MPRLFAVYFPCRAMITLVMFVAIGKALLVNSSPMAFAIRPCRVHLGWALGTVSVWFELCQSYFSGHGWFDCAPAPNYSHLSFARKQLLFLSR
jgi:hypothetical protein